MAHWFIPLTSVPHVLSSFYLRTQIIFMKQLKMYQKIEMLYHSVHSIGKKNKVNNFFAIQTILLAEDMQ